MLSPCWPRPDAQEDAEAAARLSRADLATSLVTEMTGLAGTMGRHYALQAGVAPAVAEVRTALSSKPQHRHQPDPRLSPQHLVPAVAKMSRTRTLCPRCGAGCGLGKPMVADSRRNITCCRVCGSYFAAGGSSGPLPARNYDCSSEARSHHVNALAEAFPL